MFAGVGQRFCEILLFDVPFYHQLVQKLVFNVLIKETNIIGIGGQRVNPTVLTCAFYFLCDGNFD